MKVKLTRKELYEELWSSPMNQIQDKYGVTYHRLKKACNNFNIPTPPSGYWSKVRNGQKIKPTPLPDFDKNTIEIYISDENPNQINLQEKLPKKIKPIIVKKNLRNLHPLVKKTYQAIRDGSLNQFDRLQTYRSDYIDISVNPENLKRAIRIIDAVVKELVRQGLTIKTETGNRSSKSYVSIGKEDIYFQIRDEIYQKEKDKDSDNRSYYKYEYIPTGKLKLGLGTSSYGMAEKTIQDQKVKKLEDRLDEFLPLLFTMAENMKKQRLEREEERRLRERKCKLRAEAERQINSELDRLKLLEEHAESFTKSQYIYDLIERVDERLSNLDLNEEQKLQAKAWHQWATNHANRLDPVERTVRSIFEEVNNKTNGYIL